MDGNAQTGDVAARKPARPLPIIVHNGAVKTRRDCATCATRHSYFARGGSVVKVSAGCERMPSTLICVPAGVSDPMVRIPAVTANNVASICE